MVKSIYVESDNLKPLIDWLRTKPEGNLSVLIGGSKDAVPVFMRDIGSDYGLARWIFDKVSVGEFDIKSVAARDDLPIGVVVENEL
jgi:hypothetical protein